MMELRNVGQVAMRNSLALISSRPSATIERWKGMGDDRFGQDQHSNSFEEDHNRKFQSC